MHVPQIMREGRIGLLAIQETHLTDDLADQFNTLFGNKFKLVYSPDPLTRNAKGVAIVINKRMIRTDDVQMSTLVPGRVISVLIPWQDDLRVNVMAIYAPNAPREIEEFWKSMTDKVQADPSLKPEVVLGDFNLVEEALDRILSKSDDPHATEKLKEFRVRHNLVDGWRKANPEEKGYSWMRDSDRTQSRIDRIYVHESFFNDCSNWRIEPAPIPSDHDLVSASVGTPSSPELGRGRWAIPTRLIKNRTIKNEIQNMGRKLEWDLRALTHRSQQRNPQTILRDFKTKVREVIRRHERRLQPMIKLRIEKLSEKLKTIVNNPNLPLEEIKISSLHLKKEMLTLLKETHQKNRDILSAIDEAKGEKIGKTWSRRFKENKPRDTIKHLRDPETNSITCESHRMAQVAASYHENIQFEGHDPLKLTDNPELRECLNRLRTRLSSEAKQKLTEQISGGEIRTAIRKTNSDKAPGLDGIPTELWRSLDDQYTNDKAQPRKKCDIVWALSRVFQDIEEHGMDHAASLNEGCISPIYKKKDPEDVANYRPITLLNTDYKIYTKAISLQLAEAVPEIINTDQAGFIRNRSIFDQVKTTKLVTDYMSRLGRRGAVVALDQEKAYDKILHPYLWEVLKEFGFPERFIRTVQALYDEARTTVMINGELSQPFVVRRGVRQGDALSCLLFDIAIEPLAEAIRRSENVTGIQIPGTRKFLKVKLFADDTTVFLSGEDSIEDLQLILSGWCRVSGAKFNIEKTEIIPLGDATQRSSIITSRRLGESSRGLPENIHIAKDGELVRILGAWLGNNIDQEMTWTLILENVCKRLKQWGAARHSLEGRRLIVQMQVAGVTQYLTKVQGMPSTVETELNKQVRKFMWNYENVDTINQTQMFAPHGKGGKKLLDVGARNKAIHLTWLKAYLNLGPERAAWTYFADAIIGTDIPKSQNICEDPESRVMPILQTWETRTRGSTLPEDLKQMLKLAKEYNVQISALSPSRVAREDLPIWYHIQSDPSARKLYKTKTAKCLRKHHKVKLVRDALKVLVTLGGDHKYRNGCRCDPCKEIRAENGCFYPHDCITLAATLVSKILPKWSPQCRMDPEVWNSENTVELEEGEEIIKRDIPEEDLGELITIFNEETTHNIADTADLPTSGESPPKTTTVYTDGACNNNGSENAVAGSGVWYGDDDPRNRSARVPLLRQTNQSAELMAILMAVRDNPPDDNLRIISDSKYAINSLTKHAAKWEGKNWAGNQHSDLFRCITAWIRWRRGMTTIKWVKSHSGDKGNEEADKLAKGGAKKPPANVLDPLQVPAQGLTAQGVSLAKMEQKDFYKIIRDKNRILERSRTERAVNRIKTCADSTFGQTPKTEAVWSATRH